MRRITQPAGPRCGRRALVITGIVALAFTLSGCSAANITGFDFPSFGLTKKSDDNITGSIGPGGAPTEQKKLDTQ